MMARAMLDIHPNPQPGDAFLHNSSYHGNTHAADHTILVPVFDNAGKHRFTVLAKAHQADCGNSLPTTYMGRARDVYEEGALIFPAVKVQANYEDNQDIINMCMMRIRVPEQWRGDYLAMVGSARIGEQEILRMSEEYTWEELSSFSSEWFDLCEEQMKDIICGLPSGSARATCTHDPLPGTPSEGVPANVNVIIDPETATITVDLRDNIDTLSIGINLSHACSRTAAMVGVLNSIPGSVPVNSGSLRRIEVKLRKGSCVGIPEHPTSTSVATTNLGDRVTNAVQRAFALIATDCGMAEGGAAIPPAAGILSGIDPRNGHSYINEVILAGGGGPGTPHVDGWLSIFTMGNAGMPFYDSIEIDETLHPIFIKTRKIAIDTEGAGTFRGAPGTLTEFRTMSDSMELGYCSDGTINPALGILGGHAAASARQWLQGDDGTVVNMRTAEQICVWKDQLIVSYSNGGGGFGDPAKRLPQSVAKDVREGWISEERAREVYKVSVSADGTIDSDSTASLREG